MQSSLERSSEEVMRSYIGQRVEQYSFAARPILVGTLTNIGRSSAQYRFIALTVELRDTAGSSGCFSGGRDIASCGVEEELGLREFLW